LDIIKVVNPKGNVDSGNKSEMSCGA